MQTPGQAVKNDAGQVVLVVIAVAVSVVVVCAQLIVGIERKAQARLQGQGMNLCALVEQGTSVAVAPGRARRGRKVPVGQKIKPLSIARKCRSEEHTSELQSRGHLVC